MARLIFTGEEGAEESLSIGPERPVVIAGRNKGCDLRTRNNTVSRIHARFLWKDGVVRVVDERSANGVWIGKDRVAEAVLEDGQVVFLGGFQVLVRMEPEDYRWRTGDTEEGPPPVPEPEPPKRGTAGLEIPVPSGSPRAWGTVEAVPMKTMGYSEAVEAQDASEEVVLEEEEVPRGASPSVPGAAGGSRAATVGFAVEREREEEVLRKQIRDLETRLEEGRQRQRRLEVQVEDLTRVLEQQAREIGETRAIREHAASLEQALAIREVDQKRLEDDLERAVARADAVEMELADLRRERETLIAARETAEVRARDAEAMRETMEAELADLRLRAQEWVQTRGEAADLQVLQQRVHALEEERDLANERLEAAERARRQVEEEARQDAQAIEALRQERDHLLEEIERWEVLKRQFDEDRASLEAQLQARQRDVAGLKADLEDAQKALEEARHGGATTASLLAELEEARTANRASLKKVARLMEELEKAQGEALRKENPEEREALRRQVEDLQRRLQEVSAERDRLGDLAEGLQQRIAALEASPAAAPEPPDRGAPGVSEQVRETLERINEALSEFRTTLDVLTGLIPELLDRVPGGAGEDGEQVVTALEDLARLVGELKGQVVRVRRLA